MTKEQEIYKNMKEIGRRAHTLKKCHGRWWVSYTTLVDAIRAAGYAEEQISPIISRMEEKGYIHTMRPVKHIPGKTATGERARYAGFIIDRWAN